jgi:alcohol dehydrogenase
MACGDPKAAFRIAILDPELTLSQPKMVAAVTGIDAIAHALESFVCLRRNPWSNTLAKEAWRLLSGAFPIIFTDPENIEARWSMLWGAHLAGMAIENSMLGAAHASGNPFTAHYGITHGVAVSLMLPHVIRYNSEIAEDYYQELAGPLAEKGKGAEFLASEVDRLAKIAGLPRRLRDVGISQSIFPILAEEAMQQWTGTFNPRPLTEDALIGLYESAW